MGRPPIRRVQAANAPTMIVITDLLRPSCVLARPVLPDEPDDLARKQRQIDPRSTDRTRRAGYIPIRNDLSIPDSRCAGPVDPPPLACVRLGP